MKQFRFFIDSMSFEDLDQVVEADKELFGSFAWSKTIFEKELSRTGTYYTVAVLCEDDDVERRENGKEGNEQSAENNVEEAGEENSENNIEEPGEESGKELGRENAKELAKEHDKGNSTSSRKIIGFAGSSIECDSVNLQTIGVRSEYGNRGVATELLRDQIGKMKTTGFSMALLFVRENNIAAVKLYEKFSFETIAVRKKYYPKERENALVMQCMLD